MNRRLFLKYAGAVTATLPFVLPHAALRDPRPLVITSGYQIEQIIRQMAADNYGLDAPFEWSAEIREYTPNIGWKVIYDTEVLNESWLVRTGPTARELRQAMRQLREANV